MKTALVRKLSILLFPVLLFSLIAGFSTKAAVDDDSVYLAFSSDTHYGQAGNSTLNSWLDWLQTKANKIDAIGFCGDIGNNNVRDADSYWQSAQTAIDLADGLHASGFIINKPAYVFGNHDWIEGNLPAYGSHKAALRFLNQGEAVRTAKYAIYGFGAGGASAMYNEQDISKLQNYLRTAPEGIPIIILTHYPLYDYSTIKTENADKVIQVLNTKPNVICFWGHYHAVFGSFDGILTAGSTLPVGGKNMTLNFTYLQAGCLNTNGTKKRGTIMKLSGNKVNLTRYDNSGSVVDERTVIIDPSQ